MYSIKTNFKDKSMTVDPHDHEKLMNVSIDVAAHVCEIDITDAIFTSEGRLQAVDTLNGNIYAIMIYAKNAIYDFCFHYSFKYDKNGELFLHSSDVFFADLSLYEKLPLKRQFPDSIYMNFYDDFKLYSYEVSYRSIIRHHLHENEEYDRTSVADFTYTIRNKSINLSLDYNEYLKDAAPEEACSIKKYNVTEIDLVNDNMFLNLLNYVDVGSFAMRELFDYMTTEKIKTAGGFKAAYEYFIEKEDKDMIEKKVAVIKMENI